MTQQTGQPATTPAAPSATTETKQRIQHTCLTNAGSPTCPGCKTERETFAHRSNLPPRFGR